MYSILLVEDEKSIRENLQKGISWERMGFYIAGDAGNGEEALERLEKIQPDVLLTDIRMPFMDGLELARLAKRILPEIHVVFLSSYMEFGYAREAIRLGALEYLVKPVTPGKLIRPFTELKERLDRESSEESRYTSLYRDLRNREEKLEEASVRKVSTQDLSLEGQREKALWRFLHSGSTADEGQFIEQYLSSCDPHMMASKTYCSYFFVQTLVTCMKAVTSMGGNAAELFGTIEDVDHYIAQFDSAESASIELRNIIHLVLGYRDGTVHHSKDLVWKAENYIRDHFTDPDLSMTDAADAAGLSPCHFSVVFKQRTGHSFSRYLRTLRIEEAKKLLKTTDMTTGEIAEKIGYSNVNYFSAVFHKTVGITPKAFRDT